MAVVAKKKQTEVRNTAKSSPVKKPDTLSPLLKVKDTAPYTKVFNEPGSSALIGQYVRAYQANQRQGNAHTKTRGDVSGSGKKPWKQKGTGRSRVGSIRTPVWRHGGVSHGPVTKDWSLRMPKKMKAKAFLVALSSKIAQAKVFYLDAFDLREGRTKEVLALINGWHLFGRLVLVVDQRNQNLEKGSANLVNVEVVQYKNLNTFQILGADVLVFEKSALDKTTDLHKVKEDYVKNN